MSPLVCSLFALAALLAAADAGYGDFCDSLMQGQEDYDYEQFTLESHGSGDLPIPDRCDAPNRKLVGQLTVACDAPNYKPKITGYDDIKDPFSKVKIRCPNVFVGCSNLKVKVIQYCENFIGARRSG